MNIVREMRLFGVLLYSDVLVLRKMIVGRLINTCVWVLVNTIIAAYVLPELGMTRQFGPFLLAGLCGSIGFFELYGRVVELVRDITHDKPLLYFATLPISLPLFVLRLVIGNAMNSTLLSLCVLPFGKLILGSSLNIGAINWLYLIPLVIMANLMYGAAAVLMGACIQGIDFISNAWIRVAYPLWFIGGYQFSYEALQKALPFLAYLNRLNPVLYVFEGARAAIIGQAGFLPIGECLLMTFFFFAILTCCSIYIIRWRLDLL